MLHRDPPAGRVQPMPWPECPCGDTGAGGLVNRGFSRRALREGHDQLDDLSAVVTARFTAAAPAVPPEHDTPACAGAEGVTPVWGLPVVTSSGGRGRVRRVGVLPDRGEPSRGSPVRQLRWPSRLPQLPAGAAHHGERAAAARWFEEAPAGICPPGWLTPLPA